MKRTYLLLGALVVAAACAPIMPPGRTLSGDVVIVAPSDAELDDAYTGSGLDASGRIAFLDRYRRSIEQRLPGASPLSGTVLTQQSAKLPARAFADVTDEDWATMETFYDGNELKRLRLLPRAGATPRTEEFYFNNGRLVFVYKEADGATKPDNHVEAGGEAFYFGQEGLIAWVRGNGNRADPNSAEFKSASAQLLKEAARFPRG